MPAAYILRAPTSDHRRLALYESSAAASFARAWPLPAGLQRARGVQHDSRVVRAIVRRAHGERAEHLSAKCDVGKRHLIDTFASITSRTLSTRSTRGVAGVRRDTRRFGGRWRWPPWSTRRAATPGAVFGSQARKRARTGVDIDNAISRQYTVIESTHRIDRVLFEWRTRSTARADHSPRQDQHYVNQVLDVFYVTDRGATRCRRERWSGFATRFSRVREPVARRGTAYATAA